MIKDIFIDNCIAKNFATPIDINYKNLINWINHFDEDIVKKNPEKIKNFAHLVVSQKLLIEYKRSSQDCSKLNAIPVIVSRLTIQGRLIKKSKDEIKEFKNAFITKSRLKKLLSNKEDHCHIASVLLSERKMCLTGDGNLTKDLINFPGHKPLVEKRPEKLDYR